MSTLDIVDFKVICDINTKLDSINLNIERLLNEQIKTNKLIYDGFSKLFELKSKSIKKKK